ncbi:MAG TPA: metallophosphoesterase [Steroidobacteraceae bacterium]|nr:metallophosphoesterase [Steroidobacteraceae bacterium]
MTAPAAPALSTNALRFAHVSDLHLPFEPQLDWGQRWSKRQLSAWSWRRRRAVQRPEILDALRADLAALHPGQLLVTGDVTNFSLPGEFARAAQWLGALAAHMNVNVVPGNHDALVPVPEAEGLGRWQQFMEGGQQTPWIARRNGVAFIGLTSALPTAPLLATGRLGAAQLERLESLLAEEERSGRLRVVLLHHPLVDGAVSVRKALSDRAALRDVLKRAGAELVLHGHARWARLESVPGPRAPIPVLCVPSSSALPNRHDEAARWHLVTLPAPGEARWAQVEVRQWSPGKAAFVSASTYDLRLPDAG